MPLPCLSPFKNALRLLLSGEALQPDEALRLGLYDHVLAGQPVAYSGGRLQVPEPVDDAVAWVHRLVHRAPIASVHAVKRLIVNASFPGIRGALDTEQRIFEQTWGSEEHLKRIGETAMDNVVKVK